MDRQVMTAVGAATVVFAAASILSMRFKNSAKRTSWVKPWLRRREEGLGILSMVQTELRTEEPSMYRNFLRMTELNFLHLLELIKSDITKQDTVMRSAISAEKRLALTLRFLATGESFRSLMYSTRIHESTIGKIIPNVCRALFKRLQPLYMTCPKTAEQWLVIASKFEELWSYPFCLGAIDGKHIIFRAPRDAGSHYFNYKGAHSIVLLAIVDAEYKFIYVDVGVNGRVSDGGVWRNCSFYKNMSKFGFPPHCSLPEGITIPYHFVADDAFALSERVMKPYPFRNMTPDAQNFNQRLSRARRVAENAFGILANRFRVLLSPINLKAKSVDEIVLACVAIHNFLAEHNRLSYTDTTGDIVVETSQLAADRAQHSSLSARGIRCALTNYLFGN